MKVISFRSLMYPTVWQSKNKYNIYVYRCLDLNYGDYFSSINESDIYH